MSIIDKQPFLVTVQKTRPISVAKVTTRVVNKIVQGPQGPQGVSGTGVQFFQISYGDASPSNLVTFNENTELLTVSVEVSEIFNGVGAAVSFDVGGVTVVPASYLNLGVLYTSDISPRYDIQAGQAFGVTIVPGAGATQGKLQVAITTARA